MISNHLHLSLNYLNAAEALESLNRNLYWPKWNSPWWHVMLLHEMNLTKEIPEKIILTIIKNLNSQYLKFFPINENELPSNIDTLRETMCHCALGSIYQVLYSYGIDVDKEIPWARPWFLKYQLEDGGLNCDESAYTKQKPKSSIISTLPALEALLFCSNNNFTNDEMNFLEKGASYLIDHKLYKRISNDKPIDKNYLEVRFPRFYEYDFFRGYYFLVKFAQRTQIKIPDEIKKDVHNLISKQIQNENIILKRYNLFDKRSYNPPNENYQNWQWGETSEMDLMKLVSFNGAICEPLTVKWNEVKCY